MAFQSNRSATAEHEDEMYQYFIKSCREKLFEILRFENSSSHYSLVVRYIEFSIACPKSGDEVIHSPGKILSAGDKAAVRAVEYVFENEAANQKLVLKEKVHFRIHSESFPFRTAFYKRSFPGCKEVGTFMGLIGTVMRTSQVIHKEFKKLYQCNRCKSVHEVEMSFTKDMEFPKSLRKCVNLCVGAKVEPVQTGDEGGSRSKGIMMKDMQIVKLQEQINRMNFGGLSKSYWVILEDDLIESCKPGDDVVITGTLLLKWKNLRSGMPFENEFWFRANHVDVMNERLNVTAVTDDVRFKRFWHEHKDNPFLGKNLIIKSFCPELYGMYIVKVALAVVLAGGVSDEKDGLRQRGESHLLLVGDPGTGKSQLLQYASKLMPRSVLTNGTGSTSAGLTVAAVKEGGEWHLEAGALVLADGGVCCIDEFTSMKEHDRVSIHEAMEQQTISVAKAGMVSKLKTRCTVIAAANPKLTKYDVSEDLEVNIGLSSPLLSRFDLVMVLKDSENDAWDELLCDFILGDRDVFETEAKNAQEAGNIWNTETMVQYFMLIKEKTPKLSQDAETILGRYYDMQRQSATRNVARTTVRLLQSLFRLAEGHARLMFRDEVIVHDAIAAVTLVEASMQSSALTTLPNTLHIAFPEDPLEDYYRQAEMILGLLKLPEIWAKERIYLRNLRTLRSNKFPTASKQSRKEPTMGPSEENTLKNFFEEDSLELFPSKISHSKNPARSIQIEKESTKESTVAVSETSTVAVSETSTVAVSETSTVAVSETSTVAVSETSTVAVSETSTVVLKGGVEVESPKPRLDTSIIVTSTQTHPKAKSLPKYGESCEENELLTPILREKSAFAGHLISTPSVKETDQRNASLSFSDGRSKVDYDPELPLNSKDEVEEEKKKPEAPKPEKRVRISDIRRFKRADD